MRHKDEKPAATPPEAESEAKEEKPAEPEQVEDEALIVVKYDMNECYCQAELITVEGVTLKHGRNDLTQAQVEILEKPEYAFLKPAWEIKG